MFRQVDPRPDFPKLEEEILKFWEEQKIFEKSLAKTENGKPFTFYDGPPFATGLPHYGHILASTIKDLIPRYQTMKGRYVRRRWGWDCHGLPIEEIVERHLKISGKKQIEELGIEKFNEKCRSMVLMYVAEWGKMVRRIARWAEFENSYKTMDRDYIESVWWAFKQIYDKGLVYEGRKVLLYCPRCETPVSNFEVAMDNSYKDVTEEAVTVKFKILDSRFKNTYLLAWTTTPWTLPGNVALAIGKNIEYVMIDKDGENYIVAKDRLSAVIPAAEPESSSGSRIKSGMTIIGKDLVGLEYEPLYDIPEMKSDKSYKVYDADFVNTEEGTGIVHTAVVYGEDDYNLGIEVGLPVVPMLDEKGIFNKKAPELISGRYFKDAEKIIKKDLESRGLLFERKSHMHSYPHCWRCGTMLFYNPIPAWFINIQKIKKDILKSNKKEINWFPEHLKLGRYAKSVEAAPDWNISRNRYWGNPMPVWKCKDCKKETVVGSIAELQKKAVKGYSDGLDLHRPYIDEVVLKCDHCSGEARRITEIFDSWVEAGSMPFAEFHYPFENEKVFKSRFPAQFVTEYIAQTRAWFYVMHVVSLTLFGKAPFENVLTTGTILAEDGSKLSKSKRNFPDPSEVIDKYGVDSLRFYLMNSVVMQADNLFFSEKDLATVYRKNILILWNIYNYFITYANEAKFDFKIKDSKTKSGNILDQWISARRQELINQVTDNLDEYSTVKATREIESFINDLSTWYLRRSRGRNDSDFFSTLHETLVTLSTVIAPIMPYISELIYRNLTGEDSVHLADWPKSKKLNQEQKELLKKMNDLRKELEVQHATRAKAGIKLRQPLAFAGSLVAVTSDDPLVQIIKDELNVEEVKFGELVLDIGSVNRQDLKLKGLARELERQIQSFRKESGLKIGEIADLQYETDSAIIREALEKVDRNKIYVSDIKNKVSKADFEKDIVIEDGKVKIQISKLKG